MLKQIKTTLYHNITSDLSFREQPSHYVIAFIGLRPETIKMFNIFARKKVDATTVSATSSVQKSAGPQEAIVKLRASICNQEKREAHVERSVKQAVAQAKAKMAKGDKKGALFDMKRKKMYEAEIDKIQSVKMTLETQVIGLESAIGNAETIGVVSTGIATMKEIRKKAGIEKVDDIMGDLTEEMEMANEISLAIAAPVDCFAMLDEDELLNELNVLEAEDLEEELLASVTTSTHSLSLPNPPTFKVATLQEEEHHQLKQLEAELAGL